MTDKIIQPTIVEYDGAGGLLIHPLSLPPDWEIPLLSRRVTEIDIQLMTFGDLLTNAAALRAERQQCIDKILDLSRPT
jgi:hypothetical protein